MPDPRRQERGGREDGQEEENVTEETLLATRVPSLEFVASAEPRTVEAQALPLGHSQAAQSLSTQVPLATVAEPAAAAHGTEPISTLDYKDQARDYQEVLRRAPQQPSALPSGPPQPPPYPSIHPYASQTPPPNLSTPPLTPPFRRATVTAATGTTRASPSGQQTSGNSAEVLPNSPVSAYPMNSPDDDKPWYQRYKFYILGAGGIVLIVIVAVIVVVALGGGGGGGQSRPLEKSTQSPVPTSSPIAQQMETPTVSPCPAFGKCFNNKQELQRAVDNYMNDPSGGSTCQEYGHPINNWCVSQMTDFNVLFGYQIRESFNYDISNWDTGNVVTMASMFEGNQEFNQDLSRWNVSNVRNLANAFRQAPRFSSDLSAWDTSSVTNLYSTFYGGKLEADLSAWDVSRVQDMSFTFFNNTYFNSDLSQWNVSSVTSFRSMFALCQNFTSDLSRWQTSKASDFRFMFYDAVSFDSDLSNWDVSLARSLLGVFQQASAFNGDVSTWNVGQVVDFSFTFSSAEVFNNDVSQWDLSSANTVQRMFSNARSFNRDVSDWQVQSVSSMEGMFTDATLFNQTLCTWLDLLLPGTNTSSMFDGTSCPEPFSPAMIESSIDSIPDTFCIAC